jgi:predicted small secreted protein
MKKIIISLAVLLGTCALLASCTANGGTGESDTADAVKKAETMIKDVVDGARERLEDMSEWATHDGNDFVIGKNHHAHRPIDRSRLFPDKK